MNEKEIFKSIKANAENDVKPDFSDLMKRIEDQSTDERQKSRKEALELMPEPEKRGISAPVRSLLITAAALAVTAGLGFGLIALSLGSMGAKSDSAAEPMEMYDAAECEGAVEYDYVEECEPIAYEEDVEEVSDSDTGENVTGQLDDGAASEVNEELEKDSAVRNFVEYSIGQLGMTIELPEDSYITGRSVDRNFPLLEVYGMTAPQLEANYRQRGIYCNALWYDDTADVTEIVVTKSVDRTSERIYNMKNAGAYNISRVRSMYLDYAGDGEEYYAVDTVENGQALFFRACGRVDNADGRSNHLQYMTIINGCRVEITLIEHYGIDGELSGNEPKEISREHLELMEQVVQSAHWRNVKSGFFHRYKGMIFYSTLALAAAASLLIVNIIQKKRQKQNSEPAAAIEEKENTGSAETDIGPEEK